MNGRTDGESRDAADLAGAPLDLLLTDAVRGNWRRLVPDATALRLVRGLANRPVKVVGRVRGLVGELGRIVVGNSNTQPDPRDRRYTDPAWSGNPLLHRALQAHLATSRTAEALVEDARLAEPDRLRVQTIVSNLSDALAPSNNPLLNPRALKAVVDTGGVNFVRGARRLAGDLAQPPRVPSMVEPDAFTVGETVAATPGAVVLRTEVLEVMQYAPTTEKVRAIPLLIVPPTINKYYVTDIAPGRSLIEYLVGQGHQVFTISWRNPDVRHARWGFDTYGAAILDAVDAARTVAGAPSAALLSLCSGGVLSSMVLGHLAAIGELDRIAAAALSVAVLDQRDAGVTGALLTQEAADAAVRASAARGYLDGRSLAEVFAWLRPNDLVWNYWVDSYLLGNAPKPFDVLFWNADTTRMTARLHRDFIHLSQRNALTERGTATMLGSPVDLSRVHLDTYITAGVADHLCPWQKCYQSTQLFGGKSRFVLSTSGHIASIVNPPGNKKANFRTAEHNPADAAAWLSGSQVIDGSWWPDFSTWLHARTGEQVPAPSAPGGPDHPPLASAPGSYVKLK
ncbi:MAG: poly[(R)-3-hydroxyalkanoate] polymerase subunit PhaC [Pseudonocardiales bacterium]|jgi:polyhydroxyalkanoate synthase|nr:poly[(R)-3-hydroxyalkanoate] polymerase subunit PhaC [Pseudonocardiales bacterium]MDT7586133.1 poly[(R)-3-hydroxyalkanoate] polymerase subunit PhaC [Pseudonocardiales bacterium]MDT7611180.1 poly[(R)-3-hydroxyalkanoate] polymerase subunit PhaC [Pseudonocardiales bacterium]MDT7658134.1 poly[(R)-3-hydroxyalkanoate] polymerase subunit PhaC [Pseudonocardiales bacterium]MDT7676224.1 poly[(R)-3-hydroxyalkanoate] polymerase subunit PhaC [Pseudonocardiales bacterium]